MITNDVTVNFNLSSSFLRNFILSNLARTLVIII